MITVPLYLVLLSNIVPI